MGYGFPMLKSSFTCRRLTAVLLIPFHMVFVFIGVIIIIYTIILTNAMSDFSGQIITSFGIQFIVYMYLSALITISIHVFGIKICMTLLDWKILYRRQFTWRIIFYVYLYFMMMDMVNLVFFAIFSFVLFSRIEKAFTKGIKIALEMYRMNEKMKEVIDRTQMTYQCCGADGYRDWYSVTWIDKKYLDMSNLALAQLVKQQGGMYKSNTVPFSCCNVSVHEHCNTGSTDTINNGGCARLISSNLYETILFALGLMALILALSETILIAIFRLVQTANDIAISWGDPTQMSWSYWFNSGPPPFPPNRTSNADEFEIRKDRLETLAFQYYDESEKKKLNKATRSKMGIKDGAPTTVNTNKNATNDATSFIWKLESIDMDSNRVGYEDLWNKLVHRGVIGVNSNDYSPMNTSSIERTKNRK